MVFLETPNFEGTYVYKILGHLYTYTLYKHSIYIKHTARTHKNIFVRNKNDLIM